MKTHYTAAEYQEYLETKKLPAALLPVGKRTQTKYRNTRTEYNSVMYDSRKEADRAWELDQMLKAGIITGYRRQVPYTLPGGIVYKADFVVIYPDGHEEIEDVKGGEATKTAVYRMKKKLMASIGNFIREV
jgi:hypothetical protein